MGSVIKRLSAAIISILVLILGMPGTTLASQGDDDFGSQRTKKGDVIWEGLCVGASLDLSASSQRRCARQAQATQQNRQDPKPPNIEAGLCVGASLDLSKTSQARCVRASQTPDNGDKHNSHDKKHSRHREKIQPADRQAPTQTASTYAALGDSVAAGLGLSSPMSGDERCGRTFGSYIYEVAESRELRVNHLACSGATLGDLFTKQSVIGPNIAPQLDGAFAAGTPELVTITAGANDVRWQDFLSKCYAAVCGTATDDQIVSRLISALDIKLHFLFREIERRSSGSPPEVILTGYYNPLSDSCAEIEPRLTLEEVSWLDAQTGRLNQTLENAASQYNFVDFVDIDFSGHDICSSEPWVQGLDDPAPFHPTLKGQQAIARAII